VVVLLEPTKVITALVDQILYLAVLLQLVVALVVELMALAPQEDRAVVQALAQLLNTEERKALLGKAMQAELDIVQARDTLWAAVAAALELLDQMVEWAWLVMVVQV
jgi:hypothetical protein